MGRDGCADCSNMTPPHPPLFTDCTSAAALQVTEKKAKSWCASKGNIPYFETSAKEDFNVDTAFQCVAKNALKNDNDDDVYVPDTVDMSNRNKVQEKQSGCCS